MHQIRPALRRWLFCLPATGICPAAIRETSLAVASCAMLQSVANQALGGRDLELLLILVGIAVIFYIFRRRNSATGSSSSSRARLSGIPEERWRQASASRKHSPSRQTASKASPARWVLPGETVAVDAVKIVGGNFYLGSSLPAKNSDETDNCLVNPSLRVGPGTDPAGETMPYWPSYSAIHPNARRSYLNWLASERDDPDASIGFVFLYFYGLERRFFVDGASADNDAIIGEVRRLLSIYGGNGSFRRYATQFLDFSLPLSGDLRMRPEIDAEGEPRFRIPSPRSPLSGCPTCRWSGP